MENAKLESQSPANSTMTQNFVSKFKWYITGAVIFIASFTSVAIAWSVGAFEGEKNLGSPLTSKEASPSGGGGNPQPSTPVVPPPQQVSKLTPNLKLNGLSEQEFEKYFEELEKKNRETADLGDLKNVYDLFKGRKFVMNLVTDQILEKEGCDQLAAINGHKDSYNFSPEHERIMESVLVNCNGKKTEGDDKGKKTEGDDKGKKSEGDDKGKKSEGTNKSEEPHKALKEFLAKPGMTIKALLEAPNAEALTASFKILNAASSEERNNALGSLAAVFGNLLDALIDSPSAENKDLLKFAIKETNADKLGLSDEKKNRILEILKSLENPKGKEEPAKEKTATTIFDETTFGKPIITFGLETEQIVGLTALIVEKIKLETEKIGNEEAKVIVNDFLTVLNLQNMLKHSESLKLPSDDIKALTNKFDKRFVKCNKSINTAVLKTGYDGENYRKIYDVFASEKNLEKKSKLSSEAVDIICSKAMIEQASLPAEKFGKNSCQALCLALSAHILLRDQLKSTGIKAKLGAPAIEKTTTFSLFESNFDLFNNWKSDSIKNFTHAIESAYRQYLKALKTETLDQPFFENQFAFVNNLRNFVNVVYHLFVATDETTRLEIFDKAKAATDSWYKRLQRDQAYLAEAKEMALPDDVKGLVINGLCIDLDGIHNMILNQEAKNMDHIVRILSVALKSLETENDIANLKTLSHFAKFRKASSKLPTEVQNAISLSITEGCLQVSLNDIDVLINAMNANKELSEAAHEIGNIRELALAYSKLKISKKTHMDKLEQLEQSCIADLKGVFNSSKEVDFITKIFNLHNINFKLSVVLKLLFVEDGKVPLELKKKIAMYYALFQASNWMPTIPDGAVADDSPFRKFLSDENKAFINNLFAYEYIEQTRDPKAKKFEIVTSGGFSGFLGGKKIWKRVPWDFSEFNLQMGAINKDMDDCAARIDSKGFVKDEAVSALMTQYKVPVEAGQDAFNKLRADLIIWGVKTAFPQK